MGMAEALRIAIQALHVLPNRNMQLSGTNVTTNSLVPILDYVYNKYTNLTLDYDNMPPISSRIVGATTRAGTLGHTPIWMTEDGINSGNAVQEISIHQSWQGRQENVHLSNRQLEGTLRMTDRFPF